MRILHVLDHSLPLHSGYTFRTRAIVTAQQARGLEVACLTGAAPRAATAPIRRRSTASPSTAPPRPRRRRRRCANGARSRRWRRGSTRLANEWRPDRLHAHSPVLNALAALAGGAAPRPPAHLRDPRLLGGCRGRQRHRARRLAALPPDPRARNLCRAPRRCGGGDLRGAAGAISSPAASTPTKIIVAPNGVDMSLFGNPLAARPRPRPPAGPRRAPTWSASSAPSTIMRGSTI